MLDLNKFNFKRIACSIGNTIENQKDKEFRETIAMYKNGFIATIEAQENRELEPKEVTAIHNKFFSQELIDEIIFQNPNIGGYWEDEKDFYPPEESSYKVMFNKSGGNASKNAVTPKISLKKTWLDKMGVTEENREVRAEFDGRKIIIKK